MTEPPSRTAVVCENYQQFRNWCRENDRDPRDPSLRFLAPGLEDKVQGYIFDDVIEIGRPPGRLLLAARLRLRSEVMG